VTRYVFHRLEQRFSTDTPTWLPNDEAAITWALPDFEKKGKQWLMTTAKKNVSLGFFTHSLSQVFESPLGPLLIESCPSRYFLPNPAAKAPQMAAIYQRLGLTEEEIMGIATAQPQRDVYYSCELTGKRLFHLTLNAEILRCLARNTAADHARMDRLLERYGREGFAEAWLEGEDAQNADRVWNGFAAEPPGGGADPRPRRGEFAGKHLPDHPATLDGAVLGD
jgi:type IV secretion system protein TrbE